MNCSLSARQNLLQYDTLNHVVSRRHNEHSLQLDTALSALVCPTRVALVQTLGVARYQKKVESSCIQQPTTTGRYGGSSAAQDAMAHLPSTQDVAAVVSPMGWNCRTSLWPTGPELYESDCSMPSSSTMRVVYCVYMAATTSLMTTSHISKRSPQKRSTKFGGGAV